MHFKAGQVPDSSGGATGAAAGGGRRHRKVKLTSRRGGGDAVLRRSRVQKRKQLQLRHRQEDFRLKFSKEKKERKKKSPVCSHKLTSELAAS